MNDAHDSALRRWRWSQDGSGRVDRPFNLRSAIRSRSPNVLVRACRSSIPSARGAALGKRGDRSARAARWSRGPGRRRGPEPHRVRTGGHHKNGDAYSAYYNPTVNIEYDPNGYSYIIDLPNGVSGGTVWIYDPIFCATMAAGTSTTTPGGPSTSRGRQTTTRRRRRSSRARVVEDRVHGRRARERHDDLVGEHPEQPGAPRHPLSARTP